MRRFEFVEGTSSKFWEIEQSGTQLTVRFGRIGSNGQTQLKTFGSDEAARKEHDKLVAEKTKKGYSESPPTSWPLRNLPSPPRLPLPLPRRQPGPSRLRLPSPRWPPQLLLLLLRRPHLRLLLRLPPHPLLRPLLRPRPPRPSPPPPRRTPSTGPTRSGSASSPAAARVAVPVGPLAPAKKLWQRLQKAWEPRAGHVSAGIAKKADGHELFAAVAARIAAAEPSVGPVEQDAALLAVLAFCPTYSVKSAHEVGLEALAGVGAWRTPPAPR
jgi:predicted DNA-binding WGR domain protein